MNEKPLEWMTECGESAGHKIGRIAALAGAAVLIIWFFLTLQLFALIGAAVLGVLFAWLNMHAFVEYEFCYFGGDLDVSVIYNRARRKKKFSCTLEEVEGMVKRMDKKDNTLYFCNKGNISDIYTMAVNQNGKRTALVMEPVPEFIQVMQTKRKLL